MKTLLRSSLLALAVLGSYAAFATTHALSFAGGTLPIPGCPRMPQQPQPRPSLN